MAVLPLVWDAVTLGAREMRAGSSPTGKHLCFPFSSLLVSSANKPEYTAAQYPRAQRRVLARGAKAELRRGPSTANDLADCQWLLLYVRKDDIKHDLGNNDRGRALDCAARPPLLCQSAPFSPPLGPPDRLKFHWGRLTG